MKNPMTRVVLPVVALGMAAVGFVHVSGQSQSAPTAAPLERPAQAPFADSVAASGVVESRTENISLGAALPGLVLEVYVSSECPNCGEAVRLAEEAAARYPNIVVQLIDLDELDGGPPPDPVVAVPTYVLNGRVISLGNPDAEQLFARLLGAVE